MGPPLVSIITPSFNQAAYLPAAIESVLAQDFPSIEYGIVDGGSSDGSLEIIQSYGDRLTWWVSEPDAGQTAAINKGFARARGEVLAWLNSDDVYAPGAVGAAVGFLTSHPEVGMVYGDADYVDASGERLGRFPAAVTDYKRLRRGYVHIPQQTAFFRSRLWKMVGPLDESFRFAMDYDLWVRLAALAPIAYHPRRWAGFRLHPGGKTTIEDARCWPEMIRVHRRLGGGVLSPIYARYALRRLVGPLWPIRLRWQRARTRPGQARRDDKWTT
jgi:glycosyltransferase involved in cell wall biosynthesis